MDYNHARKPPTLEVYTHSQSARNGKYYTEFYGKERSMTTNSNIMDIKNNITTLQITLNDDYNEPLVLANQDKTSYPKVTTINLHSQMTTAAREDDFINR
jgi:hypothetical protein